MLEPRGPFFAEPNFVQPVRCRDCRNQESERKKGGNPGSLLKTGSGETINIGGQFAVASMFTMDESTAGAQAREELLHGTTAGDLRVRERQTSEGMRVTPRDRDLAELFSQAIRAPVRFGPHLPVARFKGWHVGGKPAEIVVLAVAGEARENVIHAEEKFAFGEVHDQRNEIIAAALNLEVIFLADPIDAQVRLRSARHLNGCLLAEKEVRVLAEGFRRINGVVIGQGHDGHAETLAT